MRNFKIFTKLFLTHSALGLFAIITLSVIFYSHLRVALLERTLDQLSSINILKKELVENYLFQSQQNLEALQVEKKFIKINDALSNPWSSGRTNEDVADTTKRQTSRLRFETVLFFVNLTRSVSCSLYCTGFN